LGAALPLGIVAGPGARAAPPAASPLLALRARGTLLPERARTPPGRCCGRCSGLEQQRNGQWR